MPLPQNKSSGNQILRLKWSNLQSQTDSIVTPFLQYGNTPLHIAARGGHVTTAEALFKAGTDVNATNRVSSSMLVATVLIVYSFALSTAIQYISVSTVCQVKFSIVDNATATNQKQWQPDPMSEVAKPPVTDW